jgi:hypothetical protein
METANRCASTGEWRAWADRFTEDARYIEHTYGEFHGSEEIYQWISATMTSFPHSWCVCDEERGWGICRMENRFRDPGDGSVHPAHNLTVLHYAGDMRFSYEEDAYNPMNFAPVVTGWLAAWRANGRREE